MIMTKRPLNRLITFITLFVIDNNHYYKYYIRIMEPVALAYRSMVVSSSSGDPEGFSTAEDDLEQQQQQSHANKTATASEMRKKRLLFARLSSMSYACDPPASSSSIAQVRRRLSNEDITKDTVDVVVTPPPLHGILKQGRYTTSSTPSSSSNHPRRNRAHKTFSAMFLIGTVSFIIGSVANVLNGGQLLPTLLMTADSRRLKSSRVEANKATHDAFMTMLRAETAGLPEEERQRVSNTIYESRA